MKTGPITIPVILEPQPEGGFLVRVPSLPEVVTEGDTEAEALGMVEDAIVLALAERKAAAPEGYFETRVPTIKFVSVGT